MNVLLIRPPQTVYPGSKGPVVGFPLGLLSIAASLEETGATVKIFDSLGPEYLSGFHFTGKSKAHLGGSFEQIFRYIDRENPDLIGVTAPFTSQWDQALKVITHLKSSHPQTPVVVGGPHASIRPEDFLFERGADFAVLGEGEDIFTEIARWVAGELSEKPGAAFWEKGEIRNREQVYLIGDLDRLPLPAYHLLDFERYVSDPVFLGLLRQAPNSRIRQTPIVTSRGCPFGCTFCSIHLHAGRKWRPHSVAYLERHIRLLTEKYGVRLIHIEDDNVSLDSSRFRKLISIFRQLSVSWDVTNGMRPEGLDKNMLKEMKQSGCIRLSLAPESGSPRVLKNLMNKKLDLKKIETVLSHCRELKIPVLNYFVVGMPGESLREIRQTINYILKLFWKYGARAGISLATPLPGTRLYEIAKKDGLLCVPETPESYAKGPNSWGMIRTREFGPADLRQELDRFKIRYAWMDVIKNRTFVSFKHLVKMFLKRWL